MAGQAQRKTTALMASVAAATLSVTAAATASAAPRTWLPNADLVCNGLTLHAEDWVAVPPSDTLWIRTGSMAGHYVILSDTHYVVEGYVAEPPTTYDGLGPGLTRTFGTKQGLTSGAMTCDFVSRWGEPGASGTYSVIGPITISRVSG